MHDRAYGSLGRVGVVTPQANPTVEAEIGLLLPARVSMVVARSVSRGEPRERLQAYFHRLGETLQRFDTMPLDVAGFACTGSTYLIGHASEQKAIEGLEARFNYPVCTAAQAIEAALGKLGAQRIALACPYPDWLMAAAQDYWSQRGYDTLTSSSVQPQSGDTRSIYALSASEAADTIRSTFAGVGGGADAYLITGTGMPSLRLLAELSAELRRPVLSSNLCLAWYCLQRAGIALNERAPSGNFPLLAGWSDAIDRL